ncbi:MAG TPA: hypothetical protein VK078_07775 [Pseudogracilibacillus sp.]|nr:hypothetical protein [Pseudogracilibacillus sp.]
MKKHLPCLHKESGFYFVYTIWVTMLVLAVTITIITGYRLHIEEAHRLLDITRKENIIDMTRDRVVKEELFSKKGEIKEHHQYPHGEVRVTSQMVSKSTIKLIMNIQTEHHTYEEQVYVKFNPS